MKQSTKDEAKGKFHEVKGKIKEKAGRAMKDPNLEAEGQDGDTPPLMPVNSCCSLIAVFLVR